MQFLKMNIKAVHFKNTIKFCGKLRFSQFLLPKSFHYCYIYF